MKTKRLLSFAAAIMVAMTGCTESQESNDSFPVMTSESTVTTKGLTVMNDNDNREATGVTACVRLSADAEIQAGIKLPLSVKVLMPEETANNNIVLRCEADKAVSKGPAIVQLHIPGTEGMAIECVSENCQEVYPLAAIGESEYKVRLPRFSDWNLSLNAEPTGSEAGEEVKRMVVTFKNAGTVTISYLDKTGAVWTGGTKSTVVTNYLKTKVGKYVVSSRKATFDIETPGNYVYYLHQKYEDKRYKSGKAWFTARVYQGAYIDGLKPNIGTSSGAGGSTR